MHAFCEHCGEVVSACIGETNVETIVVNNVKVSTIQKHAYCDVCGSEVIPNEVVNFNVLHAHAAWRTNAGLINAFQIQEILDYMSISDEELDYLLGWNEGAISGMRRHRIPNEKENEILFEIYHKVEGMKEEVQEV